MKAVKWFIGLCVGLFITSCADSDKERLSKLVSEWEGKEIKFPAHSTFTIQGRDTVDFSFQDAEYKIVTYVDSVGCTSCKLQLPRWKSLIAEVDSATGGSVPFLFYFHPKDIKELRFLVRKDNFTYPVSFDETDEFNRLNRFPHEMMFQTFLLDKENKVVAMGNPIHNPKVKDLYLQVMKCNTTQRKSEPVTTLSMDHLQVDFGTFPQKEVQEGKFVLTNTGKGLLVIHDVTTSCGCTRVEYSKEPVRPGGKLELKVIYEAEEAGFFHKTLTVYSNAEHSPLRLTIKGNAD